MKLFYQLKLSIDLTSRSFHQSHSVREEYKSAGLVFIICLRKFCSSDISCLEEVVFLFGLLCFGRDSLDTLKEGYVEHIN